jgi:hypothetical protein
MAAPEARCGPKQTTNDEGTVRVLQIRDKEGGAILSVRLAARDSGNAHQPPANAFPQNDWFSAGSTKT